MSQTRDVREIYRAMEKRRKSRAKRPVAEKLVVAEKLRDLQKALAPARAANKLKRATQGVEIPIKTR
ncbi:MAG TPA: hypothetical protein VKD91_01570 [Pyrinomonadaceae bacterium]|nr:hypothetical protein [Pyrinomonadaceae bacterium]